MKKPWLEGRDVIFGGLGCFLSDKVVRTAPPGAETTEMK